MPPSTPRGELVAEIVGGGPTVTDRVPAVAPLPHTTVTVYVPAPTFPHEPFWVEGPSLRVARRPFEPFA
jgi:hypothetical protein